MLFVDQRVRWAENVASSGSVVPGLAPDRSGCSVRTGTSGGACGCRH